MGLFDHLTGLANRFRFHERLGGLCASETGCALLLVDLDGFKRVNDILGHQTGDVCLVETANRLSAAAENADTGTYLITNPSLAEGIPFLVTRVECQLTVKEARFCGPEGNAKLVAIVDDYLNRMDVIRVGIAAQGAPMAILGGMMGGEIAAGDEIYGSMAEDTLKFMSEHHARVVAALRALAKEGVVTADAFKPFPFAGVPSRIQPIFAGIEAKSNLCA